MNDNGFSWVSFHAAMGSNLAFALRAVKSKVALNENSDSMNSVSIVNIFGLVNLYASIMSIPFMIMGDGRQFKQLWHNAIQGDGTNFNNQNLIQEIILAGLLYYWNNEIMYILLSYVDPVTLAVGNALKCILIIMASILVFHNPVSSLSLVGSGISVAGILVYSYTKEHVDKIDAQDETTKLTKI